MVLLLAQGYSSITLRSNTSPSGSYVDLRDFVIFLISSHSYWFFPGFCGIIKRYLGCWLSVYF